MAQKFLFSKSFLLASFLLLFAGSAWAADGDDETAYFDAGYSDLSVENGVVYIYNLNGWNVVADYFNSTASSKKLRIDGFEYSYPTDNTAKLYIANSIDCSESTTSTIKNIVDFGGELSMAPNSYISGEVTRYQEGALYSGMLIRTNYGTIKGIKIKDLTIHSFTYVYSWPVDAVICGVNAGETSSITDCEVINAKIIYDSLINGQTDAIKRYVSAICSQPNPGSVIENCLVKDFQCSFEGDVLTAFTEYSVDVTVSQLVSTVKKDNFDYATIKNNCVFITESDLLNKSLSAEGNNGEVFTYQNYPLISYFDENEQYINNVDASNRVFVICPNITLNDGSTSSQYNISIGDNWVVRYTSSQDGGDGTKTFFNKETWESAVSSFCNQSGNDFDVVKYNIEKGSDSMLFEEYYFSDRSNKVEFSYYLPVARSNYYLTQKYNDKYIVSNEDDYCAMANMLANKDENAELHFIIGFINSGSDDASIMSTDIDVPYDLAGLTLPAGCSVEGALYDFTIKTIDEDGDFLNDELPTSSLTLLSDGSLNVKPLFKEIQSGAVVKNLNISIKGEYNVLQETNEGQTPTGFVLDDADFGILAGVNNGEIESCAMINCEIKYNMDGVADDIVQDMFFRVYVPADLVNANGSINIGSMVGTNKGTMKNLVVRNIVAFYDFCNTDGNSEVINYGGLIGNNEGTIADATSWFWSASLEDMSHIFNGHYGFFVAKNSGTEKNVFFVTGIEGTSGLLEYINKEESKFVDNPSFVDDYAWMSKINDIKNLTLIWYKGAEDISSLGLNEDYVGDDNPNIIKLFSNPAKWTNSYYNYAGDNEGSIYYHIPYLSFSDLDITFDEGKNVANIVIGDEKEASDLVSLISTNPEMYGNANIELGDNIELSNNPMARQRLWSLELGNAKHPFTGTFDGNHLTISNLAIHGDAGKIEVVKDADGNEVHVVTDLSLFGNIGKGGVLKNVNVENLVFNVQSTNEDVKNQDVLTIPLLAGANEGSMSHVSVSGIMRVDGSGFKDNAKINFSLVGNNDNEINNVSVFIANTGLLYKSVGDLETWFGSKSYTPLTDSLTFDNAYSYWANAMQVLKHSPKFYKEAVNNDVDLILPTFESFGTWYNQLPSDSLAAVTARIRNMNFIDASDLIHVARNLLGWYHKEAQKDLRAADQKSWTDYANTQPEGNNVAVVATQNLCKSPGKGRTHKVCSAPSGGSNNKVLLLNPYAKDVPETEMECTLDEFASGYAAHWLNYDEKGYSGSYNKMWSQGLLHPIMATDKNKYVVKLEYINEDAEDLGLEYTTYGKVGQTLDLFYTQKPTNVFLDDVELDKATFGDDRLSFMVPETPAGKGVVSVHVYFKGTPISALDADNGIAVAAAQRRVVVNGAERQLITITNLQGVTVFSQKAQSDNVSIELPAKGAYIVKAGNVTQKILVD